MHNNGSGLIFTSEELEVADMAQKRNLVLTVMRGQLKSYKGENHLGEKF